MPQSQGCSALPQGPGQVVFAGAVGEFGAAGQALVILFFVAARTGSREDAHVIDLDQFLMGVPPMGFLVYTLRPD